MIIQGSNQSWNKINNILCLTIGSSLSVSLSRLLPAAPRLAVIPSTCSVGGFYGDPDVG